MDALPEHFRHFDYNNGTQLLDGVTKSFLNMDAWVAQELQRIVDNQIPRNCYSYEALIAVIEGVNQGEHCSVICARPQPANAPTLHEASQCCMNQCTSKNNNTKTLASQEEQPSVLQSKEDPSTNTKKRLTNDTLAKLATINTHHVTRKNLTMAFMKLVFYCCRQHKPIHFYLQRHRKPLELMIELENMCDTYSSWSSLHSENYTAAIKDGVIRVQQRLHCILFGEQIPLIDKLVCPWTLISVWAQHGNQLDHSHHEQLKKWIEFGVFCYRAAKKACGMNDAWTQRQ
ncbi:hypothetical protein MUCCIDRAFT_162807 [Mucor lusitanicus CBS 277.49]|uniref:Uncharacterized protein n=2 Tax=Mucor circinelloides f. lusitanicus TaxID=29924 RepID=A0A162R8B7_MUCCL|nr:hypothetical protein MUCCIDRAFT_162807 [Mucor lusitanicus CBS 277.49]